MTSRAVLYLRLSAVNEDSTSIERQEATLRERADRDGWEVVRVLVDAGISGRKQRDNADEALRMLHDGEAEILATWALDRLTRQGVGAIGRLVEALEACPGARFVTIRDGLDSDTTAWRLIASVLSEVARTEAENTSARAKSAVAYRKTVTHKFAGGASVPFGYTSQPAPDGVGRVLVLNPAEEAIVREVAARLLDGATPLSKIAADLSARSIPTSKSPARRAANRGESAEGLDLGRWTASTLRALWTSDTLLGRVVHHGDLVRGEHGLPATVWPPILDRATLEALRARLGTAPAYVTARPAPRPRATRRARLLSGLAYCSVCQSRLYVTTSSGQPIYACRANWNGGTCPSPKVNAAALEALVGDRVLAVAGAWPEVATVTAVTSDTDAALVDVEAALREATAAMLDDSADMVALAARVAALKAQRATLRATPATAETLTTETGRTLAEAWHADEDVDWRRSVLLWALDHVTVAPTTSRRAPIDPSRVAFYWQS